MTLTYEQNREATGIAKRQTAKEKANREQAVTDIRADPRFASSLQIGAAAGGVLTGTYPNPGLGQNSVGSAALSAGVLNETHFPFLSGVGRVVPGNVAVRRINLGPGTVSSAEIADGAFTAEHFPFVSGVGRVLPGLALIRRVNVLPGIISLTEADTASFDGRYRRNSVNIQTSDIADGSITTSKIAVNAVTPGKIDLPALYTFLDQRYVLK